MLRTMLTVSRPVGLVLLTCLSIASLSLPATAATAAELLEKAIYTEETVGNLEEAIEIYEKVLTESKKSINASAQAQYRIGTCYAKQGKAEEAAAAFQAVVDNYPGATDWVAKAKSRLPGAPELLPVPWGDGDEMLFEMKLPTGMGIGHQVFRVAKTEKADRKFWECSAWQTVTINGQAGKSHVVADWETFAPIESQWKHTMLGDSKARYGKGQVVIDMVNKDEPVTLDYDDPVYDNEQVAEMFRRLPLKEGYTTKVNIVPILMGTHMTLTLKVTKIETIECPVGSFECFRLLIDELKQTFWISNDEHRYIVRFEAGGVVANLTEVRQYKADESRTLEHERFTMTLPPDWFAYSPSNVEGGKKTRTMLIDPNAEVNSRVIAVPRELIQEERGSAREWLEWGMKDNPKQMEAFSLDQKGVESITIGGQEAAQTYYEFQDGDKSKKARRTIVYGDQWAVDFRFVTTMDHFEKCQTDFEKILHSLKVN